MIHSFRRVHLGSYDKTGRHISVHLISRPEHRKKKGRFWVDGWINIRAWAAPILSRALCNKRLPFTASRTVRRFPSCERSFFVQPQHFAVSVGAKNIHKVTSAHASLSTVPPYPVNARTKDKSSWRKDIWHILDPLKLYQLWDGARQCDGDRPVVC